MSDKSTRIIIFFLHQGSNFLTTSVILWCHQQVNSSCSRCKAAELRKPTSNFWNNKINSFSMFKVYEKKNHLYWVFFFFLNNVSASHWSYGRLSPPSFLSTTITCFSHPCLNRLNMMQNKKKKVKVQFWFLLLCFFFLVCCSLLLNIEIWTTLDA